MGVIFGMCDRSILANLNPTGIDNLSIGEISKHSQQYRMNSTIAEGFLQGIQVTLGCN